MTTTPKTLTSEDCTKLLLYINDGERRNVSARICNRDLLIMLLMLDTGLRVGELVKLRWSDLWIADEPVNTLVVAGRVAHSKKERTVPMTPRVVNAIKVHHENVCRYTDYSHAAYIFKFWTRSTPLTTRQVERIIRAAAIELFGRPITPHTLRHTFATRLMQKTNIRVVQELLGHTSISSTQVYTHPNEDDKKQAICSLD